MNQPVDRGTRRRRWLPTAALMAAFLGLWGYVVWVDQPAQQLESARQLAALSIFDLDASNIQSIRLVDGERTIVLERLESPPTGQAGTRTGEHTWWITAPKRVPADDFGIDSLASELAGLTASRLIAERAEDLTVYGLAQPTRRVEVALASGSVRTLLIGDEAPVSEGGRAFYVKDEAEDAVYTVAAYTVESFLKEVDDYRERRIMEVPRHRVVEVRLTSGRSSQFSLTKVAASAGDAGHTGAAGAAGADGAPKPAETAGAEGATDDLVGAVDQGVWRVTNASGPPAGDPVRAAAVEELLGAIDLLRVERFADDQPTAEALRRYGLETPQRSVSVVWVTESGERVRRTLQIGAAVPGADDLRYVKVAEAPYVYAVRQSALDEIRWDVTSYAEEPSESSTP